MYKTKYIIALVVGIAGGWIAELWFAEPVRLVELPSSSNLIQEPREINSDVPSTIIDTSFETKKLDQEVTLEITPLILIQNLSLMEKGEFDKYLQDIGNNGSSFSDELYEGLLAELPTISDRDVWYRLVDFLGSKRYEDRTQGGLVVEDWVMKKIRDVEQEKIWLNVLSHWGIRDRDNVEYLTNRMDSFHDSEMRVSALLTLSKSIEFSFRGDQISEDGFKPRDVSNKISAYLDSDQELERAAALTVLSRYPSNDFAERITHALDDKSERVRLSAIMAVGGRMQPNDQKLKGSLLKRMQAVDAGDIERIMAWEMLKRLPLDGKYYKAVYEFSRNDYTELNSRYRNEPRRERSPWDF